MCLDNVYWAGVGENSEKAGFPGSETLYSSPAPRLTISCETLNWSVLSL